MSKRIFFSSLLIALIFLAACGPSPEQEYQLGSAQLTESFDAADAWETFSAEGTDMRVTDGSYRLQTDDGGYVWGLNDQTHDDVLIEIKYASICHSDIHQMKGDWGPQRYPQIPGHEIVGVVTAVGKNVTRFQVGDRAGVGCMVDSCLECDSCTHGEEQFCEKGGTLFTYGYPDRRSPTGITLDNEIDGPREVDAVNDDVDCVAVAQAS